MRVKSNALTGAGSNELQVIRGSMGSIIETHSSGSLIKKIRLTPIEFRRPSIVRASGHTFEYLGYGPGNYSTGLPQVQVKTLSEKENFLAQAQEASCGSVLYTGMNSDGDFYIGNTKYSAQSGQQTTFDVPIPTITGEDPSRLSVVFDEVIVKERILVEGGNSGQILSQFDGPVTFNSDVRMNRQLVLNNNLRVSGLVEIKNATESTSCTTGSLITAGGVGIAKRLNVCGDVKFNSTTASASGSTGALVVSGGVGVGGNANIGGTLAVTSNTTVGGTLGVTGATTLNSTLGVTGATTLNNTLNVNGNTTITGNLILGTQVNKSTITYATNTARTLTIPNVGGNRTFAFIDEPQTFTGTQTFSSTISGSINGNAATATLATNVVGGANRVLFNNGNNSTTTSSNLTFDGTNLSCGGDITAFASDDRLKENIEPIESALDKVLSLSGFTYNFNEIGQSLGFNGSIRYVGVSAQEVQKVLPEAVKPAPANNDYITVQYEKLVPLLIEAIKELKEEINELKGVK
jgi:hypothetical protein